MRLKPTETELVGKWERTGTHVEGDSTEKRITWLTLNALKKIAFTNAGYDVLYQDPQDGRYWELTFPQPQGFGAGPQRLSVLDGQTAAKKYNLDGDNG
jgi:hypothetical protein